MKYSEKELAAVDEKIQRRRRQIASIWKAASPHGVDFATRMRREAFKKVWEAAREKEAMERANGILKMSEYNPFYASAVALSSDRLAVHTCFFATILPTLPPDKMGAVLSEARKRAHWKPLTFIHGVWATRESSYPNLKAFLAHVRRDDFLAPDEMGNLFIHRAAMDCIDTPITWMTLEAAIKNTTFMLLSDSINEHVFDVEECLWTGTDRHDARRRAFFDRYTKIMSVAEEQERVYLLEYEDANAEVEEE